MVKKAFGFQIHACILWSRPLHVIWQILDSDFEKTKVESKTHPHNPIIAPFTWLQVNGDR
jgi:hypothetical protein